MKTEVIARLQVQGLHQWADCPLPDVAYLRDKHRHVFHVECWKAVSHLDRDTEIITLKNEVLDYLSRRYPGVGNTLDFGGRSCEMIAADLVGQFNLSRCSVLEDNENGAIVTV